jgi:hypothetical protein
MSFYHRDSYLREQQRGTQFAPRSACKGPYVSGFERLSRVIFFPDHVHPDGAIKVEGISRDDLTKRGFSIFRVSHTSRSTVEGFVSDFISRVPLRRLDSVLVFKAESVRSAKDNNVIQAFAIVDSAETLNLKGHALVLCAGKHKKSHIKELRKVLVQLINSPESFNEVYPV